MLINLKTILLLENQTDLCKIFINEIKRTTMYCSQIHSGPNDRWTHLSTFKHSKIRSFLSELLNEHLHRLFSDGFLHLNVCLCPQWVYFKAKDSCSCVLPDLKDLRGAIQTDLRLFGCSQAASPPTSSSVIPKASQHTFRLVRLMFKSLHWRITKKTRLLFFYSFFVFHVAQIE